MEKAPIGFDVGHTVKGTTSEKIGASQPKPEVVLEARNVLGGKARQLSALLECTRRSHGATGNL